MDEKTVTEREAVMRERAAYTRARIEAPCWHPMEIAGVKRTADRIAAETFPLPKVKRPRVWSDPESGLRFRVIGGETQYASTHLEDWEPYKPARSRAIADLLANPTEEVDA